MTTTPPELTAMSDAELMAENTQLGNELDQWLGTFDAGAVARMLISRRHAIRTELKRRREAACPSTTDS